MKEATPLIFNPASGGGRGATLADKAQRALAARGIAVSLVGTDAPGGACSISEKLALAGAPRIFAIGGNSFLLGLGVRTVDEAAMRIAAGEHRRVDAARVDWEDGTRHFINVFGTGFMANVCDLANRRLKWLGASSYTWAVFPELVRLRSPMTRLVLDGEVVEERFALTAVCNTPHTGGSMHIAPMADPFDGWLDVIALRQVGRARLLRLFPKIFDGSHVGDDRVFHARAREIRIEPKHASPLLGDGEIYGETPVTARVLPAALKILA